MFVEREIRSLHLLRGLAARTLHAVVPMFELEELPVSCRLGLESGSGLGLGLGCELPVSCQSQCLTPELCPHQVAKCSIFEEGDPGDAFYILVSGSVAVQKGDPAITLAILRSGGGRTYAGVDGGCFFGEMALIDGKPRMARCGHSLSLHDTYYGYTYHGYTDYLHLLLTTPACVRWAR